MAWVRARLGAKLFVTHLLVVVVGVATLLLAAITVAPALVASHLDELAKIAPEATAALDVHLVAAVRDVLLQALAVAALLATVTALLTSLVVARRIVRPVQRLLAATRRIAAGRYAERVPPDPATTHDELGQLAASFNTMAGALEQAERRRLELIGDVAHELRTPIATLEGYLEGLLDGVVEPSAPTWARLHDEARRLRRLVDDLQELSRAEARQLALTIRPAPPAAIVRAALDRLGAEFAESGLDLRVVVAPDLPPVRADQDRAVQVLTNLLTNALRYTPAGGRVSLTAEHVDAAVCFAVHDTGIGIAPEHLPYLFDRFYRADPARSRALGGSGIGLAIAKTLVEAHGGRIWAASPGLGSGATVAFSLPESPN